MKRRWSVTEGIFERNNGLWWLNKDNIDKNQNRPTPMTVALKNGQISNVIDVKFNGLSSKQKRRRIY